MARKIRLPNGEVALLIDRCKLSVEFDTEIEAVSHFDKIKHRATSKIYRRADSLLYDYVPEGKDLLVEVYSEKFKRS